MVDEEIRSVIRSLYLQKFSIKDAKSKLDELYGERSPNINSLTWWYRQFKLGRESVKDLPKPGGAQELDYCRLAHSVKKMLADDKKTTTREMRAATGVSSYAIQKVLKDELDLKKLSPINVPHVINSAQKKARVEACQAALRSYNLQPNAFLKALFTMDETWLPLYDPLSRTESMEWVKDRSELSQRPTSSRRDKKIMASVFWDSRGIIKIFWLDDGETVNGDLYRSQLEEIDPLIRERNPQQTRRPLFLQDNARPHTAQLTKEKIKELNWAMVLHPPYSPDLAPSDYFLFSNLKRFTRGKRFSDFNELKAAVEGFFAEKDPEWFAKGIAELPTRWEKCINASGNYF
ncbi:histone-lysine N-methyltransferase SETMAR-like [Tetranychus urticae]|uniref:histone-lysine N-methyltransferase SETMAR-like n=1 Tax=Tetranychus urticae TaxID=32264 RepID=UPI00077BBC63|nr:histone-lysine N-methyltransferase SETMAR-like [Tetranychus urticae]